MLCVVTRNEATKQRNQEGSNDKIKTQRERRNNQPSQIPMEINQVSTAWYNQMVFYQEDAQSNHSQTKRHEKIKPR